MVGYPPGGSGDFLTRLIADEMSKNLGVAVVAENRAGAGGNVAADAVARAPADGYTVLNAPHHSINLALYKSSHLRPQGFHPGDQDRHRADGDLRQQQRCRRRT